jgi:hypothetical protein
MIVTGRTINQLPTLAAITSASTLIIQTGNTTFKTNLLELSKSSVFGTIGQDLLPLTSNTFSIGSSGSTIKNLYVTSGSVIVGQNGSIGIDALGNTYSTSGISTTSLFIGNLTSDGTKSSGTTINIISGDTLIINQSGESINLFKQIVPTGGSISQVLAKDSGSDYDYSWQNLQGLYITGATSNGGGLNIYQSATTNTLAFKTITSRTPTHINIIDSGGLLSISGTGLLSISNNGSGAFVAQSGTSSTVALRSLSSSSPSTLYIDTSGDLILFSGKTFLSTASNSGSGAQVFQTQSTTNLSFRSLSSSTSALTINASGNHVLFNIRPKYYGSFQDFNTQSTSTNNVGVPMLFRTTDFANGISIVSGVSGYSQITFPEAGIYNVQFSSQFENTGNSEYNVFIWLRRQGVDFPGSSGYITLHRAQGGNSGVALPAWNYLLQVTGNTDYYELFWSTNNATNVNMKYYQAGNPPPAAASVILTVTEI